MKDAGVPAGGAVWGGEARAGGELELGVIEPGFGGAPAELEATEAVVGERGASEIEGGKAAVGVPLDGSRHDQVVGAEVLEALVGGAVFVVHDGIRVQVHGAGDGVTLMTRQHCCPLPGGNDVTVQGDEERPRLGRGAVAATGQAEQGVEMVQGDEVGGEFDLQAAGLGFADRAAVGRGETIEERVI